MNDGRWVIEAASHAVAAAMERVEDPETARIVGIQVTTVWETPEGLRIVSKTEQRAKRP